MTSDFSKAELLKNNNISNFDIQFFETMSSTQTYAKEFLQKTPLYRGVIIANEQTDAYGRFGKPFHAPESYGIYMTFVLPNFPVDISHITMYIAICYVRAIKKITGINVFVKWVNDLFIGNLKVAGILTEFINDTYIIGIGLNFFNKKEQIPNSLKDVITALYMDNYPQITRNQLTTELINTIMTLKLTNDEILAEYKNYLFILGKKVIVTNGNIKYTSTAIDLDDMGYLVLESEQGKKETIVAGEVSIRPF